jgi:hypothetical protein
MQYMVLKKFLPTYIFSSSLTNQNEKQTQNIKHKSAIVGEMIAFSICSKPFKPLGIPRGRVKTSEGLPIMIPPNIFSHYVINKQGDANLNQYAVETQQQYWNKDPRKLKFRFDGKP